MLPRNRGHLARSWSSKRGGRYHRLVKGRSTMIVARDRTIVLLALVAGFGLTVDAAAVEHVLFESTFAEDDTAFFQLVGPLPATIVWDQVNGFPAPGSLRIEFAGTGLQNSSAVSQCIPLDHSADYLFRADVIGAADDGPLPDCIIQFREHTSSDCSGSYAQLDAVPQTIGVWSVAEATLFGGSPPEPPHFLQFAIGIQSRLGGGPQSCNFDNIRITIDRIETAPTLGALGLAVLGALTAVAGLFAVRTLKR